jgi:O-antigen ligase
MATIFFYFVRRTKKYILGSILGSVGAAAIFLLGPSRKAIINVEEASAYNRVELWYEGILMMKSNPLFGVGYGMFTDQLPQTAHNSFILAGAELGFVGLFFFVGLIYASFKALSLVQRADVRLETYATGLQAALIGYCTAAFFLSRTYVILPYMLFALSGSLLYIAQKRNPQVTFKFTAKDAGFTVLWSLGILVFAYVLIKITF